VSELGKNWVSGGKGYGSQLKMHPYPLSFEGKLTFAACEKNDSLLFKRTQIHNHPKKPPIAHVVNFTSGFIVFSLCMAVSLIATWLGQRWKDAPGRNEINEITLVSPDGTYCVLYMHLSNCTSGVAYRYLCNQDRCDHLYLVNYWICS